MPAPAPVSHAKPMWHHRKLLSGHCISCGSIGCNFCIRPHGAVWAVILQLLQKLQGEVAALLWIPLAPVLFWPTPGRQSCVTHMFVGFAGSSMSAAAALFAVPILFRTLWQNLSLSQNFRSWQLLSLVNNTSWKWYNHPFGELQHHQAPVFACSCSLTLIVCAKLWSCTMCTVLLLSGWHAEALTAFDYCQAM